MVRYLIIFLCSWSILSAQDDTLVSSEVQWESIYENQPIQGFVTVTHDRQFEVDESSFTLEGKPLKVTLYKELAISSNSPLMLSIYQFEIPGMAKGLQWLPSIKVKIGRKIYQSPAISFEVQSAEKRIQSVFAPMQKNAFLKLEAFVEQGGALYPGLRAKVGYRYLYNTNIELTEEYLPLLDMEHFRKIGDKDIKDTQVGDVSVHTIVQNVEALEAGSYSYGPSVVVGNAYTEIRGKRHYLNPQLVAEAPLLTVVVNDFPTDGKPASFNGAVGEFSFAVKMLTSSQVRVGDKIALRVDIKGTGQLENVVPPDLCCQPGFSGFFKTSDLPAVGKITNDVKTFLVEIYPLIPEIEFVPPIEFSYFDPIKEAYQKIVSAGIPLKVFAKKKEIESHPLAILETKKAIAIYPNYLLSTKDLKNLPYGSFWVIGLIPLGLLMIFVQQVFIEERKRIKDHALHSSSQDYFQKACKEKSPAKKFKLYEQAFLQLYLEKSILPTSINAIADLPEQAQFLEVKALFTKIDEARFSGKNPEALLAFSSEAEALFNQESQA
ncbi:Uncharacterized protein PHSC3_001507 [Chlamydiales bacterium STE3]|nr:Uncharacterized protein PHSC3_001507 [Chlamydiales bacterium STE3]